MKRLLLSAAYSSIEPLGLMHLAGLAKGMGWDVKISLSRNHDFTRVKEDIDEFEPDFVGFNIYTGNHLQTFNFTGMLRQFYPDIKVIVGGPHPTYFPLMAAEHADYVVMSEGFSSLRGILDGKSKPGIHPFTHSERFPLPARDILYQDYPEYAASRIKSIIGMTGCPYRCTYCYNSSSLDDIQVSPEIAQQMASSMNKSGRLFPHNVRSVDDIITEAEDMLRWPTDIVYFQDDVHGFDTKQWLPELGERWPDQIGLSYHAQMRWEMVNGDGGEKRLDQIVAAGCTGLTLAIESADEHIRKEVLDRATPDSLMYDGMANIRARGLRVRTEQIMGLPYGATTCPSPVNIEADLALVELNVRLKPDIAWASTFAPYMGTKLAAYAIDHGHYKDTTNGDVPDNFFDKSVLRFPRQWIGRGLSLLKHHNVWLDGDELEHYRMQNAALRRHFNLLCGIPKGHILARQWLEGRNLTSEDLNDRLKHHLYDEVLYR